MKSQCSEDIICDSCSRFTTAAQKCSTVLPRSCHHWDLVKSGILDGLLLARHLELKLVHVILKWLLEIYANLGAMLQHDMNRSKIYLNIQHQCWGLWAELISSNFKGLWCNQCFWVSTSNLRLSRLETFFFLNFSSPIKVIIAILLNSSDYTIHSARSYGANINEHWYVD